MTEDELFYNFINNSIQFSKSDYNNPPLEEETNKIIEKLGIGFNNLNNKSKENRNLREENQNLRQIIKKLENEGITTILTTHSPTFLSQLGRAATKPDKVNI